MKKPTEEQIFYVIREHLPYEAQHLAFTFNGLCLRPDGVSQNILIAAFSIYARNLIDFFTEQSRTPKNYAGAKHFIPGWVAFEGQRIKGEPFYGMLNEQSAHLTYNRKRDTGKLGGKEINQAKQLIDAEVIRFVDALPEHWRKVWNEAARDMGLYH